MHPLWQTALALAKKAINLSDPNPRVGCVIASPSGEIISTGHTQQAGGPHAEVMALRDAQAKNISVKGATAWVTLEPCSHYGRTPPCANALIEAGIARVNIALQDPNPKVVGNGIRLLKAAGIEVDVLDPSDEVAVAAYELNIGFMSRMTRGRPWVRMKVAASLDGLTALPNGKSQWITSDEARKDGHAYRSRASAVLTGIGTLLADDPLLDVRLVPTSRQPTMVIVDSKLETPASAKAFSVPDRAVLIYTASSSEKIELKGLATVVSLANASGKVDLQAMLNDLAMREVNELHLEAGSKLNGSFVREGLVDEFLIYMAPKLIGEGWPMASFGPLKELSDSVQLRFVSSEMVGADLRILARTIKT